MRQPNIHRPESLEWGPFEGVGQDIVEGIRRIKSEDGPDLILAGSSTLTSTLLEHGLAVEVLLAVYPVLLGTGKRFFAEGTPARSFELVSTKAFFVRHHLQCIQVRRAIEDRIVRVQIGPTERVGRASVPGTTDEEAEADG